MFVERNYKENELFRKYEIGKINKFINLVKNYKLRISTDIDGVEVFSALTAVSEVNKIFNSKFSFDGITAYQSLGNMIAKADTTIEDPQEHARKIWNSSFVLGSAPWVPGSLYVSRLMHKNDVFLNRITARPSHTRDVTRGWYSSRMPWVSLGSINVQDTLEYNLNYKSEKIKDLQIDIHIEDSLEDALQIVLGNEKVSGNKKVKVIMVPWRWNEERPDNLPPNIIFPKIERSSLPKIMAVYAAAYSMIS